MNKVILIGNLTKDPELRYTPNGVAVATFTVAVNRPRTNQAGEREADFINIVAWQNLPIFVQATCAKEDKLPSKDAFKRAPTIIKKENAYM